MRGLTTALEIATLSPTPAELRSRLPGLMLRDQHRLGRRIERAAARLAARPVAERIAEELGTEPGSTVGYKVRFTDTSSDNTLVKLMTDGILLTEMQHDPRLLRYDTLIIDEAHERSLNVDFILGYLR